MNRTDVTWAHASNPSRDIPAPTVPLADTPVEVDTTWLAAGPDTVAVARSHVGDVLTSWGIDSDCVDDAVLLVSEVVTNVVRHSPARTIGIDVGATARRVVVGVRESHVSDLPQPNTHMLSDFSPAAMPGPRELRGRGLGILDALAAEWGISRAHLSTSTWFTLAPHDPPPLRAVNPAAAAELESVQASLARTRLLLRITESLGTAVTAEQVGDAVTRHLRDHLGAMFTGIALFTHRTASRRPAPAADAGTAVPAMSSSPGQQAGPRWMRYLDLSPFPAATRAEFDVFPVDFDTPVAAAAATRTAYFHPDRATAEAGFPGITAHMTTAGTHAMAHLPLLSGGKCLGTLALAWSRPRDIDADTRALLTIVAGYAATALHRHTITDVNHHGDIDIDPDADTAPAASRTGRPTTVDPAHAQAVARAEQRLADAHAEFDAALEFGESLAGLVAIEHEIKLATAALTAALHTARTVSGT